MTAATQALIDGQRSETALPNSGTLPEELAASVLQFYRADLTELVGVDYSAKLEQRITEAVRNGMAYAARIAEGAARVASGCAQNLDLLPSDRAEALGAVKAARQIADSIRVVAGLPTGRDAQAVQR